MVAKSRIGLYYPDMTVELTPDHNPDNENQQSISVKLARAAAHIEHLINIAPSHDHYFDSLWDKFEDTDSYQLLEGEYIDRADGILDRHHRQRGVLLGLEAVQELLGSGWNSDLSQTIDDIFDDVYFLPEDPDEEMTLDVERLMQLARMGRSMGYGFEESTERLSELRFCDTPERRTEFLLAAGLVFYAAAKTTIEREEHRTSERAELEQQIQASTRNPGLWDAALRSLDE